VDPPKIMENLRNQRIKRIAYLEEKQRSCWHVGIQRKIDNLYFLTGEKPAKPNLSVMPDPARRNAGEYAAYLAKTM